MEKLTRLEPQKGFQHDFLSSPADIVIGGASAGVGKTFALLLDPARYFSNKDFGAVIFRRTTPMIRGEGGLWNTSEALFPLIRGTQKDSSLTWTFPSGARLKFSHLEYEKDKLNWQGAQIPYIGFDELTQFTESQFFYLISRNRSTCGVPPCVRATCNPDPDSWVAEFIEWYIDQKTGFPIPERCGKIRYFTRDGGVLVWGDSKQEVIDKCPHIFKQEKLLKSLEDSEINLNELIKSFTFIPGSIYDNKALLSANPQYLGNLMSLPEEEKKALLDGNWKIKQDGMSLGNYGKIESIFSNYPPETDNVARIICDVARFGKDLAVIAVIKNGKTIHMEIFTKSSITDLYKKIEELRQIYSVTTDDTLVDQDGVGGGLVDMGNYHGFTNNAAALPDPVTNLKENYKNLKTQCYYRFFNKVNLGHFGIDAENIWIDGVQTQTYYRGNKPIDVVAEIKKQLRTIKRFKVDSDGKKQINSKEAQKNLNGGVSPDFGDVFAMSEWFGLRKTVELEFIEF